MRKPENVPPLNVPTPPPVPRNAILPTGKWQQKRQTFPSRSYRAAKTIAPEARAHLEVELAKDRNELEKVRTRLNSNLRECIATQRKCVTDRSDRRVRDLRGRHKIEHMHTEREMQEVISSYRYHPSRALLDLEEYEVLLFEAGRFDEMLEVRRDAERMREREEREGWKEMKAKIAKWSAELEAKRRRDNIQLHGKNHLETAMFEKETARAKHFMANMQRIHEENQQQQHNHARRIICDGRPDMGADKMKSIGMRRRFNIVSKEKHPIPSLSAIHEFNKPKPIKKTEKPGSKGSSSKDGTRGRKTNGVSFQNTVSQFEATTTSSVVFKTKVMPLKETAKR